jgi:hypothetical protein
VKDVNLIFLFCFVSRFSSFTPKRYVDYMKGKERQKKPVSAPAENHNIREVSGPGRLLL